MQQVFTKKTVASAISLALTVGLVGCGGDDSSNDNGQPVISARTKGIITVDGKQYKDLNSNGKLDSYENWQLTAEERADDLISKMTLDEKAGLMMIDTLGPGCEGTVTSTAIDYLNTQRMKRFILRTVATAPNLITASDACPSGSKVTPQQLAVFTNTIQSMAEGSRLGIPVVFKDNARNHVEVNPQYGITAGAGAFTQFPKEAGLAAAALGEQYLKEGKATTGDMSVIKTFTEVMGPEYNAVGLRAMYGYMADLSTEPRWYRVHETFTEDADLNANIMKTLVEGLQGGPVNRGTKVALTMKHFPGGGPQELGLDPHYSFGKNQVYPGNNFGYHLKPFKAAIDAGVSSIMPYYGVPINVTYDGVKYEQVGMAFSKQIVTDLLRGKLGFKGYVNSDTGIINTRAWGLEDKTVSYRIAAAVNGGTETLSGYHTLTTITDLISAGLITQSRVNEAAKQLLLEQFKLGLFENPYVDAGKSNSVVGSEQSMAKALDIQKKSIVLLDNKAKILPLKSGAKLYTMGMDKATVESYGYTVTDGNYTTGKTTRPAVPAGTDVALIRVLVTDKGFTYNSKNPATGANPAYINPLTGMTWGSQDPCVMYPAINATCSDTGSMGGALPWEVGDISFSGMAKATSRTMYPTLDDIKAIMNEIGDPKKVVLSIYFRAPYVMDDNSDLKNAGAIVATFGVGDKAMMEVVSGKFKPQGKMPFALPKTLKAVEEQKTDVPGYDETTDGALYKFGYGITY